MKDEMNGKIIELFDQNSGIILGEDKNEYYYWKIDFLNEFTTKIDTKVKFKPEQYITNKNIIYKATYISKNEKEII